MKPNFALDMSHEGIVLLHRSPRNTWTEVGDISLEDPKLAENLSFLRSTAVGLEGKGFGTKLIIPESQVLYVDVEAPGPSDDEKIQQIKAALEGLTPYDVVDLEFDWRGLGDVAQVAVIAKETLDEAEGFAMDHRFNPLCFVSLRDDEHGIWEPFFGCSDFAVSRLGKDVDLREKPTKTTDVRSEFLITAGQDQIVDNIDGELDEFEETDDSQLDGDEDFPDEPGVVQDLTANEQVGVEVDAEAEDSSDKSASDTEVLIPLATDQEVVADSPDHSASEDQHSYSSDSETVPSFISRRQAEIEAVEASDIRPIERIESRILVQPSTEEGNVPPLAGVVDQNREHDANPASAFSAFREKLETFADTAVPAFAKLGSRAKLSASAANRYAAATLGGVVSKLKSVEPNLSKPNEDNLHTPEIGDSGLAELAAASSDKATNRKRQLIVVAACVLLLGLAGTVAGYFLSGDGGDTYGADGHIDTTKVSLTDLGITPDNRAAHRPENLETDLALLTTPDQFQVRPEPRSIYENGVDPDAGQPDTVEPLTDLTAQELEDIRSAGLTPPGAEEFAEGSEAGEIVGPTEEEIAALYKETGIQQGISARKNPSGQELLGDIFIASIDRQLLVNDAIALLDFSAGPQDPRPYSMVSPAGADVTYELNDKGLVAATKDGAINPDGVLIFLGRPDLVPPTKPEHEVSLPLSRLAEIRPKGRPADLKTGEDAIFVQGRLTMSELRRRKPKLRPQSEQIAMELQSGDTSPSEMAVLTSFLPTHRPANFSETVEKTRVILASATPPTAPIVDTGPVIPTRASVAKLATQKNAINRSALNLIGVYGTANKRRALLRLPSGRFVKVEIGDRIDGGRIAAIGDDTLSYIKSGRNRVLKVPN